MVMVKSQTGGHNCLRVMSKQKIIQDQSEGD